MSTVAKIEMSLNRKTHLLRNKKTRFFIHVDSSYGKLYRFIKANDIRFVKSLLDAFVVSTLFTVMLVMLFKMKLLL